MLGKGWFPDELGGLDRYYRDLLEHLPEASGIVLGRGASMPANVTGAATDEWSVALRLLAVWRAAQRAAARTDVVDAHFALYALVPLWLGRLRCKPVILHFHGPWADESVASGDRSGMRLAARRLLERATYTRADAAVTLTSSFRQVLVERYGVAPWIVTVEPPGVDLELFSPGSAEQARTRLGLAPHAFVALSVRRLVPRMGLEVLIDAWCEARSDLPEGSALLIAGDGPLRRALASAVAAHGAGDSVRVLGRVDEDRLRELYRAADVAVVPSLEHEGFGLVVLEAAACGTPSIVSDAGGLPEAIAGLDHSLVLPAGDARALRERLLRARTDLPSRAATRAYAERFGWSAVAERHREIARRLVTRESETAATCSADHDRLRVVYLDHTAQLSGGEIALLRLLPHLDHVHPHVLLGEDGPLVSRLHLAGISTEVMRFGERARGVHREEVHRTALSPAVAGSTAAYILRLAARLRRLAPDLVHTNSLKAGLYGCIAARLAGVPAIWHVRDRIAADYMPPQVAELVRFMSHHLPAAVITNSHATMDTLAMPPDPGRIRLVLPEVLGDVPYRERVNGGPLRFGIVGRLAPWKGQDLFLQAFARAFPDGLERAVVVGGALFGEHDYANRLPALVRELGLSERVEFRGQRPDVWDELERIDVLVHSSLTPEPFGQVILEGMAAGVPIIAAGAGGPAEILQHDVTGVLYRARDIDGLAASMQRMRDPKLRRRLSEAARAGLGRYSPPVVAAQLEALYAAVVARYGMPR